MKHNDTCRLNGGRNGGRSRSGFTLVELLIVMVIIAILAAILFPAFQRAREGSYQTRCMTNLQQIGFAVQLYQQDEKQYPSTLTHLVSLTAVHAADIANDGSANKPDVEPEAKKGAGGGSAKKAQIDEAVASFAGSIGYLKSLDVLECPDDDTESLDVRSSYGDIWSPPVFKRERDIDPPLWNFYGYNAEGIALNTAGEAASAAAAPGGAALLLDPARPYHPKTNPIRNSLSNRNAPADAIVTHCRHHRVPTSNLRDPDRIYSDVQNAKGARDALLRVDGSAKVLDVSGFKNTSGWQK